MCRRAESLLKAVGTHEWCRAVILVLFQNGLWDVNPRIGRVQLLVAQLMGEDRVEVFSLHRLVGLRVQGRQRLDRHVGLDVVPLCRDFILREEETFLIFVHLVYILLGYITFLVCKSNKYILSGKEKTYLILVHVRKKA